MFVTRREPPGRVTSSVNALQNAAKNAEILASRLQSISRRPNSWHVWVAARKKRDSSEIRIWWRRLAHPVWARPLYKRPMRQPRRNKRTILHQRWRMIWKTALKTALNSAGSRESSLNAWSSVKIAVRRSLWSFWRKLKNNLKIKSKKRSMKLQILLTSLHSLKKSLMQQLQNPLRLFLRQTKAL